MLHTISEYYQEKDVAPKIQLKVQTRLSQIRNQIDHFELIES